MNKNKLSLIICSTLLAFSSACESEPTVDLKDPINVAYERGRTIYQTQCTACHNADPHKTGVIGPDVFGSSRELLEARILRTEYPKGYQPKRQTHQMTALPHLKDELDALTTFLNKQ